MPFEIYKRGKIWHYRGTVGGQRLRGSCRTTSKEIAQRYANEIENRAWKGHLDGPGAILTFANAVHSYRAAGKSGRFLEPIEDHFQDKLVKDIKASEIRQLAITLYPNASGATRNRNVIVPAQAVINFAADQELCDHIRIKRFPVNTKVKTPVTWDWVTAFMAHANPHLGALCAFMFLTGARVSEAIGVLWSDVDLGEGKALIRQSKVGKERIAHLPPELVKAIEKIEGDRVGKVFKYSSRHTAKPQWNKAVKRAGIAPLPFHSCRHGFATTLLRNGVDAVTVAKLGGWSGPQLVFSTYGHAAEDRTIVNKLTGTLETQPLDKNVKKR